MKIVSPELLPSCRRGRGLLRANMHFAALELDGAFLEGEQRVISADADVEAGVELGAALADDDRAGGHELPAIRLHPAILRIAVSPVLRAALTLLMCHMSPSVLRASFKRERIPPALAGGGRLA